MTALIFTLPTLLGDQSERTISEKVGTTAGLFTIGYRYGRQIPNIFDTRDLNHAREEVRIMWGAHSRGDLGWGSAMRNGQRELIKQLSHHYTYRGLIAGMVVSILLNIKNEKGSLSPYSSLMTALIVPGLGMLFGKQGGFKMAMFLTKRVT